jgi:mannobiose 2-epimerase
LQTDPNRLGKDIAIRELHRIAQWWLDNTVDRTNGGFVGEVDYYGRALAGANKGIILHSRILWFFSTAARIKQVPAYRDAAERAFHYLLNHFDDPEHGGAYWELAADGSPVDCKKQTYALCFCIYGFIAYFRLTADAQAQQKTLQYFDLIETHARDPQFGGYFEAFERDWRVREDVRLAADEMNAPKTMNTHLHLLEAYSALHSAIASPRTDTALRHAVDLFCDRIVNADSGRLHGCFDRQWNVLSTVHSFGHDIEASWLLWEAGEILADARLQSKLKSIVQGLADACHRQSFGDSAAAGYRCVDEIWWVQAEAMVGFLNAFQLTGEQRYRSACDDIWRYICQHHIDIVGGEWHWFAATQTNVRDSHYKAGPWKGPYHNGRAMIEVSERLARLDIE